MQHFLTDIHQILSVTRYNFRMWRGNLRVILTFLLAFILCFLLSDKVASFAYKMETSMQIVEPFIWTFGDSNSILLISLLLILLFADMPFLGAGVPYYLVRMNRRNWLIGQALYVATATLIYMVFILGSTAVICMQNSFSGNMWSHTAALLGYSNAGEAIVIPALVKTLEMSFPYQCMITIFGLMLMYTLLMVFIMLYFNIKKGQFAGILSAFAFSLYGFLLNPELVKTIFQLPDELMYKANVAIGWLSPLNHATYHMHNFGYDLLPRMWHTYAIFAALIVIFYILTRRAIKKYNFNFIGNDL
ncbi:MAG: hypothetical protein GX802_04830 [Clostridiales bacterium]|nr:hypothetical protein [Clostridiales bacterium]